MRCSVCKEWYCTAQCQANHWPVHRRECVEPPALEWPNGSRYDGQLEELQADNVSRIEQEVAEKELVKVKDVSGLDGSDRIEKETAAVHKQTVGNHIPTNQDATVQDYC